MIFNKLSWDSEVKNKQLIIVSSSLSFEKMNPALIDAWELFFIPLFGASLCSKIVGMADGTFSRNNVTGDGVKEDEWLLAACRRAVVNLAMWYDYTELNTRITDMGHQRQESDTFKSTYKYQEDNLRSSYKAKGFNSLDRILDFLYDNITLYAEFKASPSFISFSTDIVRNTAQVQQVYDISSSRIIYLRLRPHLTYVENQLLRPAIGEELWKVLHTWLANIPEDLDLAAEIDHLRILCGRYVIMQAVKRLLQETGSLTDRGLYFQTISGGDGNMSEQPVSSERVSVQIQMAEQDSQHYMTDIMLCIKSDFPSYYTSSSQRIFDRDNDGKKIFMA